MMKVAAALLLAACSSSANASSSPETPAGLAALSLVGARNRIVRVGDLAARAKLTVFVFFSADCHCLSVHEPRLRALAETYRARGARFFWIDSEAGDSVATVAAEAERRGTSFPILLDPGASVADWFGAEYATYSVIVDSAGVVRYRGGIDSDKVRLRDDATPYLKNALDDLLAGGEPRRTEGEALGCSLRKR